MVRTLPAIPVVDGGDQRFQPMWYEDAGEALARAVDAPGITGRVLELAGPDATTMNDLLDRLETLVGRRPRRVRVPGAIASMSVHVATLLGFKLPVSEARLTMLDEENVIPAGRENALQSGLGVTPTSLDEGLKRLIGVIPEQLPSQGVGPMVRKRYWADIEGGFYRAAALRDVFRRNVAKAMPFETRRDAGPVDNLKKNMTFEVMLPLRGALAMRVEEITPDRIVCATLEGHPLAGILVFDFIERGRDVRFEVCVHARQADVADAVLMAALGDLLQDVHWRTVVDNVVKLSGGRAPEGVQMTVDDVFGEEAARIDAWAEQLKLRRLRGRIPPGPPVDGRRRARREPGKTSTATATATGTAPKPSSPRRRRAGGLGGATVAPPSAIKASARTSGKAARPAGARKARRKSTRSTDPAAAGRASERRRRRPATSGPSGARAGATRGRRAAGSTETAPARPAPAKARRRKSRARPSAKASPPAARRSGSGRRRPPRTRGR
jgi:hypothetical protein